MALDYKKDVEINKYKLHEMCEFQSSLFLSYSEILADVEHVLNDLKKQRKIVRATKSLDYRQFPKEGLKVTDSVIESLVEIDKDVIAIEDKIVEAQYQVDIYNGVVESFRQRKGMITDLVRLHISGIFSSIDTKQKDITNLNLQALKEDLRKIEKEE